MALCRFSRGYDIQDDIINVIILSPTSCRHHKATNITSSSTSLQQKHNSLWTKLVTHAVRSRIRSWLDGDGNFSCSSFDYSAGIRKKGGFIFSSRGPSLISAISTPRRTTRWKGPGPGHQVLERIILALIYGRAFRLMKILTRNVINKLVSSAWVLKEAVIGWCGCWHGDASLEALPHRRYLK